MPEREPKYTPISRDEVPEVYRLMDELIKEHHASDLCEAQVGLAWIHNVKADRDGHMLWGRAKKVGELERNYIGFDFIILLNRVWGELAETTRRALLDHELSHCGGATDDNGETTYYLHKHDVEDFVHIVRRYGLWKADIEALVNAALQKKDPGLFDGAEEPIDTTTGEVLAKKPAESLPTSVTFTLKDVPAIKRLAKKLRAKAGVTADEGEDAS